MKKYLSPFIILANGTINMNVSQLGQLGVGEEVVSEWDKFWEENGDVFQDVCPDFNVNDPSTWINDFDLKDPSTWFNPIL